jgi:outer membrane murein-binding lipoprotein Lpp
VITVIVAVMVLYALYRMCPRKFFRSTGFELEGNLATKADGARLGRASARKERVDLLHSELSRLAGTVVAPGPPSVAQSSTPGTPNDNEAEGWGFRPSLLAGCLSGLAVRKAQQKEAKVSSTLRRMTEQCEALTKQLEVSKAELEAARAELDVGTEDFDAEVARLRLEVKNCRSVQTGTVLYATPECEQATIQIADDAKKTLQVLAFSFDLDNLVMALNRGRDRQVDVELICSRDMLLQTANMRSALGRLHARGCKIKLSGKRQHIKAIGADTFECEGRSIILSGSFNFTRAATRNYELLVRSEFDMPNEVPRKFATMFKAIWNGPESVAWSPDTEVEHEGSGAPAPSESRSRNRYRRNSPSMRPQQP